MLRLTRREIVLNPRQFQVPIATIVYRLQNPLGFVAFKMGRLRGVRKEHIWIDT